MIHRSNIPSNLTFGVVFAALAAAACGQGPGGTGANDTANQSVADALRAIRSCQSADPACGPDAGGPECDAALKSCLVSALPDAGAPSPKTGMNGNGGVADSGPGKPPTPAPSGQPSGDGGGSSSMHSPAGPQSDAGPAPDGCIDTLRACLESTIPARTCASAAHACLEAIHASK